MDPEHLRKLFGRRVSSMRKLRDLTQEDLAERSDISVEYISRIERGLTSPSFDTISTLCQALRVEPRQLFDFSELTFDQTSKE